VVIGLAVGIVGLVIGAPWLSTVTPLYVDHYHLALDPIIFALLGLGAGVLWRRAAGRAVVAVAAGGIVAWNLVAVPLPPVDADGGWPAGLAAGQRVVDDLRGAPAVVIGVPKFKKTTAVNYPMTTLGNRRRTPAWTRRWAGGEAAAGAGAGATRGIVSATGSSRRSSGQACWVRPRRRGWPRWESRLAGCWTASRPRRAAGSPSTRSPGPEGTAPPGRARQRTERTPAPP